MRSISCQIIRGVYSLLAIVVGHIQSTALKNRDCNDVRLGILGGVNVDASFQEEQGGGSPLLT